MWPREVGHKNRSRSQRKNEYKCKVNHAVLGTKKSGAERDHEKYVKINHDHKKLVKITKDNYLNYGVIHAKHVWD